MVENVRRNLAVTLVAGGTNPLRLRLKMLPVTIGVPVTGSLVATGGTAPYAFSITGGSLPTGLSLNSSTGAITGTPSAVGDFEFTASVTDSEGPPVVYAATFLIHVSTVLVGVAVTPLPFEQGYTYSYQFQISGNTGAVTWTLASGSLPTNVTLSSGGLLSASPFVGGVMVPPVNFKVTASDAGSGQSITFSCSVGFYLKLSNNLTAEHVSVVVGTPKTLVRHFFGWQGGVPPFSVSIDSSTPLPAGLTLSVDPNTGNTTLTATAGFAETLIQFDVVDLLGNSLNPTTTGIYITGINPVPSTDGGNALSQGSDFALFASGGGGGAYTVTNHTTSATMIANQWHRITANSVALTTPAAASADGTWFGVIFESAYTGCSLVAASTTFLDNGVATTINLARIMAAIFVYNATTKNWFCIDIKTGNIV